MYFLGIDGGGTKTTGVLSDLDGNEIRAKKGKPGNPAVLGKESFSRNIEQLLQDLLQNLPAPGVKGTTIGLAGAGREAEKRMAKEVLSEIGLGNCTILTDVELLYYSVHRAEPGIVISSGTGSVCMVQDEEGHLRQLGGWGYLLGDEGSGFDIGRMAIRNALTEAERGEKVSPLTAELLGFYQVKQASELITRVHASANPQNLVASCAQLVCGQCNAGEVNALLIIESAAQALIQQAISAIEHLPGGSDCKIALTGGLLRHGSPIRKQFLNQAHHFGLKFNLVEPSVQPAAGAVIHAINRAGESVSESLRQKLENITFA